MAAFHTVDLNVRRANVHDMDVLVEFNAAMALESEGKSLARRPCSTQMAGAFTWLRKPKTGWWDSSW